MNIFSKIARTLKKIGTLVWKALDAAGAKGLTDEVLQLAIKWAKVAAGKQLDNAQRREFVVGILTAKGIPESIARLAVELAVQAIKSGLKEV